MLWTRCANSSGFPSRRGKGTDSASWFWTFAGKLSRRGVKNNPEEEREGEEEGKEEEVEEEEGKEEKDQGRGEEEWRGWMINNVIITIKDNKQ